MKTFSESADIILSKLNSEVIMEDLLKDHFDELKEHELAHKLLASAFATMQIAIRMDDPVRVIFIQMLCCVQFGIAIGTEMYKPSEEELFALYNKK
jgi:hypothetical protein